MSRRSWKAAELALARFLGGERVPVSGRARGWAPDILHPWLSLEVKTRKNMPLLLRTAMDQAVKAAGWYERRGQGERMPAVVIHQDGTHFENSLVVVRLKDARDYWGFGDGPTLQERQEEMRVAAEAAPSGASRSASPPGRPGSAARRA